MKIQSTNKKGSFEIIKKDNKKLLLEYKKWFSSEATITNNSVQTIIKPSNNWESKFDIIKKEVSVGSISFNWKGNVIIEFSTNEYLLKANGLWKLKFELFDKDENPILILKPKYELSKLSYNYEIYISDSEIQNENIEELVAISGFAANLYISTMMAG